MSLWFPIFSLGLTLLLALSACGGGNGDGETAPGTIGTLAYALTECRDTPAGFFEQQQLRIRQGDHATITVAQPPEVGPIAVGGLCRLLTMNRSGNRSVVREAIQAVLVSPDGATVAFEVSDAFSVFPPLPLHIPPEQQGIFIVRSDGTGLRWLAPPSREPFVVVNPSGAISRTPAAAFSPDGRQLAVIDKGPDASGNQTSQLVLLDVASGARTQITHLPPAAPPPGFAHNSPTILAPTFVDNETIAFGTFADPDGSNRDGKVVLFTVKTRASFQLQRGTAPVALPGAAIVPIFAITGARPFATLLGLFGVPTNDVLSDSNDIIREVFLIDGRNLLQLTNFGREDTNFATGTALVDVDGERVYFDASANPPELGNSNPTEDCQIFSVDRNGSDLRQLTFFSEAAHSKNGCTFRPRPGCASGLLVQDSRTRQLIMNSNCNPPEGTNPDGYQVFAMNPDGSGLQQLTDARGLVKESDGTFLGELPGPSAYGPYLP